MQIDMQFRRVIEKISKQDEHYSDFNSEMKKFGVGEDEFCDGDF